MSDAKNLHEAGVALFREGEPEAALEKLTAALTEAVENPRKQAEIYNDIGVVQRDLEAYAAAHLALDQAMELYTTLNDQKGQAQTWGNRGAVLEDEERYEEAVAAYKQSARMLEAVGENSMAMYVWQAISRLRANQGEYLAAIGAYEEGVDNMPDNSLKKKVLKTILQAPTGFLGGGGGGAASPDNADDGDDT
jgi:tetratricopeptide (TPR) repeat protein